MSHKRMLVIVSLISIVLISLHLTDDFLRNPGGTADEGNGTLVGIAIIAVWLTAALLLSERKLGVVVLLLGAIFAMAMPVLHLTGGGHVGGTARPRPTGDAFFLWGLMCLGVTGFVSLILSLSLLAPKKAPAP